MSLLKKRQETATGESQRRIDWTLCLMRWAMLALIAAIALFDPEQRLSPTQLPSLLLAIGAYNLTITLLLIVGLFANAISLFTLVADVAALLVLLLLSGGVDSPFFFFPLFPILVATLRFNWRVGLLVAGIFILGEGVQMALVWEEGPEDKALFQYGLHVLLFLAAVVVGGVAGRPVPAGRMMFGSWGWRRTSEDDSLVPEQVKLVLEMASTLSATLNYNQVLEAILDISRLGFDELGTRLGEAVGLVLLHGQDGLLHPATSRGLVTESDNRQRIKGVGAIVGEAIATAEPIIAQSSDIDPELHAFQSLKPCKSVICVPLRAGFETYGVVLFASVKPHVYTHEHGELLSIFCNQAAIALRNADLASSLREEREEIIDKEDQARKKLARDLHDGPTQDVAAIAMRLNFARLLMERDPLRAKAELERLEDMAHHAVKNIRSMLFTLRPIVLETEGLVAALNQYADNLRENDGLPVEIDADHYQDCLDMDTQGVVFAIIEEAVNNAKKHAEASRITIQLGVRQDIFVARVIDDGQGFDVQAVEADYSSRGSLGMVNLKERAELVDGRLTIDSAPGQGTRITLIVPIDAEPI